VPSGAPTQRFTISAFSLLVYTNSTAGAVIDSNELENILDIFISEQVRLELPGFEMIQLDLVLVALPKAESQPTSTVEIHELIMSGDLMCTRGICPTTNQTDTLIYNSISENVDIVLMLFHEAYDPVLQSSVGIHISKFSENYFSGVMELDAQYENLSDNLNEGGANTMLIPQYSYEKITDNPKEEEVEDGGSNILIPLLTVASLCLFLMASAVYLLYRVVRTVPPQESIDSTSQLDFDSIIVCTQSEETQRWRNIKTDSFRTDEAFRTDEVPSRKGGPDSSFAQEDEAGIISIFSV